MGKKKLSPIALLRQQFEEFKRGGIVRPTAHRFARCYVCGRKSAQKDMRCVGKGKDGDDVYRHEHCEAGSASWLKHYRHKSKLGKYFSTHDANDQQDHR